MFSILTELKNIGIKVVAITTDQGSNFAKCFKNLGVSISEPFFNFQNEKIYVLCDVPHLIKSVRNTLKNYNIRSNDGTAKWYDIRKCYELNLSNNFKFIPKVTEKHINVPPFGGKMKVKLATQVLSASMATAIHTATIINIPNKLGSDAVATAKFCNKMNNLFDVLNSSCVTSSSPYKRALTTDGISWKYLAEMCNWISSWVIVDVNEKNITNRIKCKSGWLQTINATTGLFKMLSEKYNWNYLLTRRLCQDGLENFFGLIRKRGGLRENPSCSQFIDSFKIVAIQSLLKPSKAANCLADKGDNIIEISNMINSVSEPCTSKNINEPVEHQEVLFDPNFFSQTDVSDIFEQNAMMYVSGYIALRINKFHPNCTKCNLKVKVKRFVGDDKTFLKLKCFTTNPSIGLVQATEEFHKYFVKCEDEFGREMMHRYLHVHLKENLIEKLKRVEGFNFCEDRVRNFYLDLFIRMRIHFLLKFKNQNLDRENIKKRKIKKILHA